MSSKTASPPMALAPTATDPSPESGTRLNSRHAPPARRSFVAWPSRPWFSLSLRLRTSKLKPIARLPPIPTRAPRPSKILPLARRRPRFATGVRRGLRGGLSCRPCRWFPASVNPTGAGRPHVGAPVCAAVGQSIPSPNRLNRTWYPHVPLDRALVLPAPFPHHDLMHLRRGELI